MNLFFNIEIMYISIDIWQIFYNLISNWNNILNIISNILSNGFPIYEMYTDTSLFGSRDPIIEGPDANPNFSDPYGLLPENLKEQIRGEDYDEYVNEILSQRSRFRSYLYTIEPVNSFSDWESLEQWNTKLFANNGDRLLLLMDNLIIWDSIVWEQTSKTNLFYVKPLNKIELHELLFINIVDTIKLFSKQPFIYEPIIFLENLILIFQKIFYNYFEYLQSLIKFYGNYQNLTNKIIVNTNNFDNFFNTLSLNLLLNIQFQNHKVFFWLFENLKKDLLNKNIIIEIFKNYNYLNKNDTYSLFNKLYYLNKKHARINILTYGLFYDLNIKSNDIGFENNITPKAVYNNFNENNKLLFNHENFVKTNIKINKYFNKNLIHKVYFKNIYKYNNLVVLTKPNDNFSIKIQKYLIDFYFKLYVDKENILKNNEKNYMYHYFFKKKHYTMYNRDKPFELFLPYKGHVHYGYEDNLSYYINDYWKKKLLYTDQFFTRYIYYKDWSYLISEYVFGFLFSDTSNTFLNLSLALNLDINPNPTWTKSSWYYFLDYTKYLVIASREEMIKKILNFFFYEQNLLLQDLKLFYFKYFIFNVDNLTHELTGIQYMPMRDYLNHTPWERLATNYRKELDFHYAEKLEAAPVKTFKHLYLLCRKWVNVFGRNEIYNSYIAREKFYIDSIKLKNFGGYSQWWAWQQDSIIKKPQGFFKKNPTFIVFLKNINENIKKNYNNIKVWYPLRQNCNDLGTFKVDNTTKKAWKYYELNYIQSHWVQVGGLYIDMVSDYDERIILDFRKRGPLGSTNVAKLTGSETVTFVRKELQGAHKRIQPTSRAKVEVKVEDFILQDATIEEMKADRYKSSKGYSMDRKIADYKQEIAQKKLARERKFVKVKTKKRVIRDPEWLIKPRNLYLGHWPESIKQPQLEGIEPRVEFKKGEKVASVHDRVVIWGERINRRWRKVIKAYGYETTPWLVLNEYYSKHFNRQHGETFFNLNKKSWKMFLTGDDVFLIDNTLGILKKKERDMPDEVQEAYLAGVTYADAWKYQKKGDIPNYFQLDLNPYNLEVLDEAYKDYLREYKIAYLKGNFNWPKKIQWAKTPYLYKYTPNSNFFYRDKSPFFSFPNWLTFYFTDIGIKKQVLSTDYSHQPMKELWTHFRSDKKKLLTKYVKAHTMEYPNFRRKTKKWSYVFNFILKDKNYTISFLDLIIYLQNNPHVHKDFDLYNTSYSDLISKDIKVYIGTKSEKFNLYKKFFKRMKNSLIKSESVKKWGEKNIISFFLPQYIQDSFIDTKNKFFINYIKKDIKMEWSSFYTNIEDLSGFSKLHIIEKDFYTSYIDKKQINQEVILRKVLTNNINLPKTKHILLKKSYIISLIDFFQKDENLVKNYLLYNIRKEQFIYLNEIIDFYKANIVYNFKVHSYYYQELCKSFDLKDHWKRLILEQLVKVKAFKWFINFYNIDNAIYFELLKYILIITIIIIYCGITSLLVVLIKNCIPNNIIYGVKTKEILYFKKKNYKVLSLEQFIELEHLLQIDIKEKEREEIFLRICKTLNDVDKKKVKMFFFKKNLKKFDKIFRLERNVFDAEHKYIYMWEKRQKSLYMNAKGLEDSLKKVRVYNKFESKKNQDLKENYITLYQTLKFEKNLEKLKDNTKARSDFWYNKRLYSFLKILIKGLWFSYKDKKFNVSKLLFWNDDELFNQLNDKIKYVYVIPRPLEDVKIIIRFLIKSAKEAWSITNWVYKLYAFVLRNEHVRINYREIMQEAEKYVWYHKNSKRIADIPEIYFLQHINKILTKFKEIKELPLNKKLSIRIKQRENLLNDIITLSKKELNLINLRGSIQNIRQIEKLINNEVPFFLKKKQLDKIERHFENKFSNIQNKLTSKSETISLKKWKEQELRVKYLNAAYANKFEFIKEDYEQWVQKNEQWLQKNEQWIKNFEIAKKENKVEYRNLEDLEKDSQHLNLNNFPNLEHMKINDIEPILYKRKKITKQKKVKKDNIEYQKYLRAYNLSYKFIDEDLDKEDVKFYESIPDYNKELDNEYLKIEEQEKSKKMSEMNYEKTSSFLYEIFRKRTPYSRWWPTIGMRLNYVLAQVVGIFYGVRYNMDLIRRNNYSFSTLFPFLLNDIYVYIYRMYWEYLIIWKKRDTLKNLGNNIKDIFKFSLLLTPIIIYSIILYLILLIIVLLCNVFLRFPKNCYQGLRKTSNNSFFWKKKLNVIIFNLKKILNILSILFKDLETGNSFLKQIYYKFYKLCAFIQYNLFYIKGAYLLGYKKNNKIKDGIVSIKELLKLKFIVWFEKKKRNWPHSTLFYFFNTFWGFDQKKLDKVCNYNEEKLEKMDLSKFDLILILCNADTNLDTWRKSWDWILNIKKNLWDKNLWVKIDNVLKKSSNYRNFKVFRDYMAGYEEINWNEEDTVFNYNEKLEIIKQRELKIKFNKDLSFYSNLSIKDWLTILALNNQLNWKSIKELLNFLLIKIWNALRSPFQYFAFMNSVIYITSFLVDIPKKSRFKIIQKFNNWTFKIHNIIVERQISEKLKTQFYLNYDFGDVFFIYKIEEVKWKKKNYYQDYFWRSCYWEYKKYREIIFTWLIRVISEFEENYGSFDDDLITKKWTLREKISYARVMITFYNHAFSYDLQRKKSRDVFFYKKINEKHKLERIYFLKGLLNWITYTITGKVIFSKTKNLKKEVIKYKKNNIKYELNNIKQTLHLSDYIKEIPPQFWSLFIIYNKYYKYFLRYLFKDLEYPVKWKLNSNYELSRNYKWRLAPPDHNYQMTYLEIRNISMDLNTYNFEDFMSSLSNVPYDPMIRWLVFILEHGMTREQYSEEDLDMLNKDTFVWGDISLTHLLTYNKKLDQYKYEIREFDRLVEGLDKMYVRPDSKTVDKEKFYRDRFDLVSRALLKENEGILKNLLDKRRLKNAKMLHRALVKNRLKTYEELQQENERENMKEFFYSRKKLFFEQQLIEQYWDWQAEFETKIVEDKYFNTRDIWYATYNAQELEESFLKKCKIFGQNKEDYKYLLNNIILKSYDQTIEEIHYFLVFKVWKILEKQLKIKNKKTQINYKHLNSNLGILEKINYDKSIVKVTDAFGDKTKSRYLYINHYDRLEWEYEKNEAIYNFPENNLLLTYYQVGLSFTYEDKIKFNKEAERYHKDIKVFHGHEYLLEFNEIIKNRIKNIKNISKILIGKKKIEDAEQLDNIVCINNIKWTWQQWLLYTKINKENVRVDKTIVILNERFNLWNLKRMPIRIKLPVLLDLDTQYAKTYFANKSNYMSFLDHRHFMMTSTIGSYLKQSMDWEVCKKYLEKHFNKDIKDLILWIFTADALNREVLQIKKDYAYVLDNFARNYNIFHKLFFVGMAHYTWDLVRYHKAFQSREDLPYDQFFRLKQLEFLNHDPGITKIAARLEFLYLDKYSPVSYVYLFKTHFFFERYFTRMYNLLSIASFVWIIKILFYTEVEYLSENYVLFVPLLAMFFFWYLRKRTKVIKDHYKGEELYLYRFKSSKPFTSLDRQIFELKWRNKTRAWLDHFYGTDKVSQLFINHKDEEGNSTYEKFLRAQIDTEWWRYHTHKNKDNKIEGYEHIEVWILFFIGFYLVQYWKLYQFEYRNSPWIWHYYKISERTQEQMRLHTSRIPTSYKLREWIDDSYARFENGGNTISRFLENHYRQKKGLSIKPLDYGHDWQIITETIFPIYHSEIDRPFFYKVGYGEMEWLEFSKMLSKYHRRGLEKVRGYSWFEIIVADPRELLELYNKKATKRMSRKYTILEKYVKFSMEYKEPLGYKRGIKQNIYIENVQDLVTMILERMKAFKRNDWVEYDDHNFATIEKDRLSSKELLYQEFNDLFEFKKKFKKNFKKWLFDKKYIDEDNPYREWYEFGDFVMDKWNFDINDKKHIFPDFLFKMQNYADEVIENEKKFEQDSYLNIVDYTKYFNYETSYSLQILKSIEDSIIKNVSNYKNQINWRYVCLIQKKIRSLETGENMDISTLLSIKENEKHFHNYCYNMLKYKLNRIEIITQIINKKHLKKIIINEVHLSKKQNLLKSYKETNSFVRWWYSEQQFRKAEYILEQKIEKIKEVILKHQLKKQNYDNDLNNFKIFFKKYENFLHKITKKINVEDVIEYKCNLILKYWDIKKDFWTFMADFTEQLGIIESISIIIKILTKFF